MNSRKLGGLLVVAMAVTAGCPNNGVQDSTSSSGGNGVTDAGVAQGSSGSSGTASGGGSSGSSGGASGGASGGTSGGGSSGASGGGTSGGNGSGVSSGGASGGSDMSSGGLSGESGSGATGGASSGTSGAVTGSSGGAGGSSGTSGGASASGGTSGTVSSGGTSGTVSSGGTSGTVSSGGTSGTVSSGGTSGAVSSGGTSGGGTSGGGTSSGGASSSSGGNPLQQTYEQFCSGMGTVGSFGAPGMEVCSGQLAEESFKFALCACEQVNIGSQLSVDGFDSAMGPYGGANVRDTGDTGMNQGPLSPGGQLSVRGSLYVSGGGAQLKGQSNISRNLYAYGNLTRDSSTNVTVERNAFVHGNVSTGYRINGQLVIPPGSTSNATGPGGTNPTFMEFRDNLPCPCGENEKLDVAAIVAGMANNNDNAVLPGFSPTLWATGTGPASYTFPCGRFYVTNVMSGGLTFNVTGRVALFVDGDFDTGGFSVTVAPGAELDLFVRGNLRIGASARFGPEERPASMRTYVGGNLDLNAQASFAGNVYAPNGVVQFSGMTEIHGALFVRRVSFGGNAEVHYDNAIRRAGDACPMPDAGMPMPDAGTPMPDAGTPAGDAGVRDAGGTDANIGGGGDGECGGVCDSSQCNGLQCVNTPAGGFTCGLCTSDLDCCAPLKCNTGFGTCVSID